MKYGITFKEALHNNVTSIKESVFYGFINPNSITISKSGSSISEGTFYESIGQTAILISNTMTSINTDKFYGCHALKKPLLTHHLHSDSTNIPLGLPHDTALIKNSEFNQCLTELNLQGTYSLEQNINNAKSMNIACTNIDQMKPVLRIHAPEDFQSTTNIMQPQGKPIPESILRLYNQMERKRRNHLLTFLPLKANTHSRATAKKLIHHDIVDTLSRLKSNYTPLHRNEK